MNKFFAIAVVGLLLPFCGRAQTNYIYTTNFVRADPNFRVVNNQVYNITNSPLWTNLSGRVWLVAGNLVVIEKSLMVGLGTNAPQKVALTNYEGSVAEGNRITALAMRVGQVQTKDLTMELWDCGTYSVIPEVKTNEVGPLDHEAIKKERL